MSTARRFVAGLLLPKGYVPDLETFYYATDNGVDEERLCIAVYVFVDDLEQFGFTGLETFLDDAGTFHGFSAPKDFPPSKSSSIAQGEEDCLGARKCVQMLLRLPLVYSLDTRGLQAHVQVGYTKDMDQIMVLVVLEDAEFNHSDFDDTRFTDDVRVILTAGVYDPNADDADDDDTNSAAVERGWVGTGDIEA